MKKKPKIVDMGDNFMETIWEEYRDEDSKINKERLLHAFNNMATVMDLIKSAVGYIEYD